MNKSFNQFQQDVSGTASNLMTQMLCAERGLDYNQLQYMAQQSHLNGILQAEQQRQMNQVINRHYQGDSFVNKVRDVFGGKQTNFLAPQPMQGMPMAQPVMQPQIGTPNPYGVPANMNFAQGQPAPYEVARSFGHQPIAPQAPSAPAGFDIEQLRGMITDVVSQLVPAPAQGNQQHQYQQAPSYPPQQVAGELDV